MAYNKKSSKKEEPVNVITDPAELAKFKQVLVAITRDLQIIDDHKECIKETVEEASTLYSIEKKLITKLAKTMYKSNYQSLQEENQHFALLYETLTESKLRSRDPISDDEDDDYED